MTAQEQIEKAYHQGKLSGSWLITGAFGVGKQTFARRLIGFLLTGKWEEFTKYHLDVLWVEKEYTDEEKKDIQKQLLAGKEVSQETLSTKNRKKELTTDVVHAIQRFLSLKTSSKWRIVCIPNANEMNLTAQNAFLKTLEEPPENVIILLLCENKGNLLQTICSRCRTIHIPLLSSASLEAKLTELYPSEKNLELVAKMAEGSVGRAKLILENEGISLYQQMQGLFVPLIRQDTEQVLKLSEEVSKNPQKLELFCYFTECFLSEFAKGNEAFVPLYSEITALFNQTKRLYLDVRQMVMQVFFKIGKECR